MNLFTQTFASSFRLAIALLVIRCCEMMHDFEQGETFHHDLKLYFLETPNPLS